MLLAGGDVPVGRSAARPGLGELIGDVFPLARRQIDQEPACLYIRFLVSCLDQAGEYRSTDLSGSMTVW
jgi:hypothetical protein